MAEARVGDTVTVHYTGTLQDGSVFDSSQGEEPLEFTIGQGQVIPRFEQSVVGMAPGESKKVDIVADEAYGQYRQDMVIAADRSEMPPDLKPEVGDMLQMQNEMGQMLLVTVTEISDKNVMLDANHPLAGQDLTFDIKLVGIDGSI